jgi:Tfp pilus assembly PilM family ATPase
VIALVHVGLDIGASTVKAVLVEDGARHRLAAASIVDHELRTWAADLVGERRAQAAAALRPLLKRAISGLGWTRQYRVRVTIPDHLVITQIQRPRDVPADLAVARLAMGEAVRKELNLAPAWSVADCVVIERPSKGSGRPCRVAVAVTSAPLVDALHTLLADLGCRMTHLDTNTWAISSLSGGRIEAPAGVENLHGVLNLGHSFISLSLYKGDVLEDYAVMDGGGAECCEMLAPVVGGTLPREVMKRRRLIPLGEDKDDPLVFEGFGAIAPMIMKVATLVRDRLESYALYWGAQSLGRLHLAGGLAALPNLAELLQQEFTCPVRPLPVAEWMGSVPDGSAADLPLLAPAIGMALRKD